MLKDVYSKHFVPTELMNMLKAVYYKHFVPTELSGVLYLFSIIPPSYQRNILQRLRCVNVDVASAVNPTRLTEMSTNQQRVI